MVFVMVVVQDILIGQYFDWAIGPDSNAKAVRCCLERNIVFRETFLQEGDPTPGSCLVLS